MKEFEGKTSFFSLHRILHQEALCAKSLKMSHVIDTVAKTVNFILASALNHCEFVALLGEIESEHGEIIYYTNMRWLSRGSVLQQFFYLLKEIKLFMEKKNKRIEELDDEEWISDVAFFFVCVCVCVDVDVTGHLNTLNKELQGKDKLIREMFNNVKAFKVKL
jgi:hypothetical protein